MMDVDRSDCQNDAFLEMSWAIAAYNHAETHYNILCAVPDARILQLSAVDDRIYTAFYETFPHLNVDCITEDGIKSGEQKELWRSFCNEFDGVVEDYNRGTLLRLDSSLGYEERNTCIVPRVQFLAIEIARNRRGLNNRIHKINSGC
ncbi:Protein PBDC1 [Taenia crassiceps]|uniref:Protein PBDC1 n=1 Tax=Taenia crassiceps TaxID=6207 RepID=A0ABR4QLV3_9CEST